MSLFLKRTALVAAIIALACTSVARAESTRGTWTLNEVQGRVQLDLAWSDGTGNHNNEHTGDVDAGRLGIASALASSGTHTTFAIHHEAGDYALEGWIGNGKGSGQYTFTANDAFFETLAKRGYAVAGMNEKMAFANLDITIAYVDDMERLGFKDETNHLIAMKALGVTPQYVAELQSIGISDLTETHVISLKAMHIDRAYVQEIASAGYPHLAANQYVTLKAMHVDAAYIKYLAAHGFKNLTVNQVVSMKAQGI